MSSPSIEARWAGIEAMRAEHAKKRATYQTKTVKLYESFANQDRTRLNQAQPPQKRLRTTSPDGAAEQAAHYTTPGASFETTEKGILSASTTHPHRAKEHPITAKVTKSSKSTQQVRTPHERTMLCANTLAEGKSHQEERSPSHQGAERPHH